MINSYFFLNCLFCTFKWLKTFNFYHQWPKTRFKSVLYVSYDDLKKILRHPIFRGGPAQPKISTSGFWFVSLLISSLEVTYMSKWANSKTRFFTWKGLLPKNSEIKLPKISRKSYNLPKTTKNYQNIQGSIEKPVENLKNHVEKWWKFSRNWAYLYRKIFFDWKLFFDLTFW